MYNVNHVPEAVEGGESHVEITLFRVLEQCKVDGIAEPQPGNNAHENDAIARTTTVDVQHFRWISILQLAS